MLPNSIPLPSDICARARAGRFPTRLTSRLDGRSLKRNDLWPLRRLHYNKRKSIHSLHHLSLDRNPESEIPGHDRTIAEQSRLHLLQLDRFIFPRCTSQRSKKLLPVLHQPRSMGVLIRIVQNLIQLIRLPLTDISRPLLGAFFCRGGGKSLRLYTPQKAKQQPEP